MALDPNVPQDNYILSSPEGVPIPLDVLRPNGVLIADFLVGSLTEYVLPASAEVAIFYASEECYVVFEAEATAIVSGEFKPNCLFCPKGHAITSSLLSETFSVRGLSKSGSLVIQVIERWAGLSTDLTYTNQ